MKKEDIEYLEELNKQDLTILTFQPYGHRYVVHKNTQKKISNDFIGKGKRLSEFLDHLEEEPGLVHLYAENFNSNKHFCLPDQFQKLVDVEREEMNQYSEKTEFPDS